MALSLLMLGLTAASAAAQTPAPAGELRIAVREDDRSVQIYHTALVPIEHGFNLYRRDTEDGEYVRLNAAPIRSVRSGAELRDFLGTLYTDIEAATGQDNANSTLAKVRSDTRIANLLTFIYPEAADALGRRFIDRTAPLETVVSYRMEFVDARDEPTGLTLEQTLLLLPSRPEPPIGLRAVNDGRTITLYWRFVPPSLRTDDRLVRFEAFRIDPATNAPARLHDAIVLRNNAVYEYAITFEAPTTGQTERLFVQGVDFTGQAGAPSAELRFDVLDARPPQVVSQVTATPLSGGRVRVSWAPGGDEDVHGYQVYRSEQVLSDAGYSRITGEPLGVGETVFNDTLRTTQGGVFFYRVSAIDDSGNESPLSNAAMVLVADDTEPLAPTGLTARYEAPGVVRLAWEPTAADAASYLVLRRRMGDETPDIDLRLHVDDLTEPRFVDAGEAGHGFREGGVYRYSMMAVDAARNLSAPAVITVRIPDATAPEPPGALYAVVEQADRLALTWNPSPSTDLMAYILYRQKDGDARVETRMIPPGQRRYEAYDLEAGQTYTFWVTAADSAGNESARSERQQIAMRDALPPRSVRNVRAEPLEDGGVTLAWEPVVAFDLAGYHVYRAASATGVFEKIHEGVLTERTWLDAEGLPGQWYRVYAVDTSGNESQPSGPACAVLPQQP
ncbi:MAG: fibronectin type III domain-containing protein [Rhodothermales bacterium]